VEVNDVKKTKRPSRLSKRVLLLNLGILVLVIVVAAVAAAIAMNRVSVTASMRLAYIHSLESIGSFMGHVNGDVALLRRVASTEAVQEWFADEGNMDKRQAAFDELSSSLDSFENAEFYFAIVDSLNEYTIDLATGIGEFAPYGKLAENDPMDEWFFELVNSDSEVLFNIDVDKIVHRWRVWANHRVVHDGRTVGVLCASFNIEDIIYHMFGQFDENHIRGYVIDSKGFIHLGSDELGHFSYLEEELFHISSVVAALGGYVDSFVGSSERFFTVESQPKVVRLLGESFAYAAIAPIANSDWMIVTLFDSTALFRIGYMLPLLSTFMIALTLYVLVNIIVMRRSVLKPLAKLAISVSQVDTLYEKGHKVFGEQRDDEFGELSRTIAHMLRELRETLEKERQARELLEHRTKLLDTVNRATEVLLTSKEEDAMGALISGMEILGRNLDAGRVQIWRQEEIGDELYFVLRYEWVSAEESQRQEIPPGMVFFDDRSPEWLENLLQGDSINGPISGLHPSVEASFGDISTSVLMLPLLINDEIIGFFSIHDSQRERTYSKDEMDILVSAGLMFTSVFNQSIQREAAHTDALTGVQSRRYFMTKADQDLQNCLAENQDFSLIIVDLDNFKLINDTYGHSIGDEVLKIVAARMRHVLRENTLIARYGGEEFVITLPDVGYEDALESAQRIKQNIEKAAFRIGDVSLRVTASFGVASKTADYTELLEIFNNADKALYSAKSAGKNRVIGFDEIS